MADVLALVLRRFNSHAESLNLPRLSDYQSCIVVGECDSLKTSLLFLAAITAASELGVKILFLSPAPVQSLPAPLQDALAKLNPDSLKKIQFKYPRSQDELLHEIAALHELTCAATSPPSLLIVDAMERYIGPLAGGGLQPKQAAAAHISALLNDTAAFLTQKLEERGDTPMPCHVIASYRSEQEGRTSVEVSAPDSVLAVLDRYFPVRCTFVRGESGSTSDTATEKRELWHVYFSGAGITAACSNKPQDSVIGHRWLLFVCENGAMEFSVLRTND